MRNLFVSVLAGTAALAGTAFAQTYPERPITMIVPFAAGGPTDAAARIVGAHMSKTLGQQIIIENITGAGGSVGTTRAAQAKADGYTLIMGHMGTHGAAPALYPNLRYDPVKDFEPVGLAVGTPIVIVAKDSVPVNTLGEFMAYAHEKNTALNMAYAGVGSVSHVTGLMFTSQLKISPALVSYRGTGPALNDLVAGQVDFMCDQIVNVTPQIKAGTIKALAIATPERSPALPDVPTTKEAGMPEYQVSAWNAVFAPKGTPAPIVERLNAALVAALDDRQVRKTLLDLGGVIPDHAERTPQALGHLVASEVARWTPILKVAGQPTSAVAQ